MHLNGTSNYIQLPNRWDPSGYSTSGYSIELWVKFDSSAHSGTAQSIVNKVDANNGVFMFRWPGDVVVFGTKSGGSTLAATTAIVPNGGWRHLVGTLSGNTVTLYADGVATSQTAGGSVFPAPSSHGYVVGTDGGTASFLPGSVDSLAIYNRVLSAPEITCHFKTGSPLPAAGCAY
ncbi:MAG: LamG domain-containing protein [Solirubrobacterales bacterium]